MTTIKRLLLALTPKFLKGSGSGQVLFNGRSLSGPIRVVQTGDRLDLITGDCYLQSSATLSGSLSGTVWDFYLLAPLFLPEGVQFKSLCLLGLGAGVTANLFRRFYPDVKITGVEIDPLMVELGKKYFGLDDKAISVHISDAARYLAESGERWTIIIVDTFYQDIFANECESREFYLKLRTHLELGGVVLVNRAVTKSQKAANENFLRLFVELFPQIYTVKVHHNTFYLGPSAPTDRETVLRRIKDAATAPETAFFGSPPPAVAVTMRQIVPIPSSVYNR